MESTQCDPEAVEVKKRPRDHVRTSAEEENIVFLAYVCLKLGLSLKEFETMARCVHSLSANTPAAYMSCSCQVLAGPDHLLWRRCSEFWLLLHSCALFEWQIWILHISEWIFCSRFDAILLLSQWFWIFRVPHGKPVSSYWEDPAFAFKNSFCALQGPGWIWLPKNLKMTKPWIKHSVMNQSGVHWMS